MKLVFCKCGMTTCFSITMPLNFVLPNGQPHLQPKVNQVLGAIQVEHAAGGFVTAEPDIAAFPQTDLLREVGECHHSSQGSGMRGDEQAVIAAGGHAADGAGGISSQAVCHQPFAREQGFAFLFTPRPGHMSDLFTHRSTSGRSHSADSPTSCQRASVTCCGVPDPP
jgi:hypothetical protein